jgi:hypothetical protein
LQQEERMKNIAMLCALAALAACSEAETTAEANNQVEPAAAEATVASWPMEAGTYEYTRSDGTSGVNTVKADGTFSNAITGGGTETGTWREENGLSCLTPEGGEKRCYTFTKPDADGNFTGTLPNGVTAKIRKTA